MKPVCKPVQNPCCTGLLGVPLWETRATGFPHRGTRAETQAEPERARGRRGLFCADAGGNPITQTPEQSAEPVGRSRLELIRWSL